MEKSLLIPSLRNARITSVIYGVVSIVGLIVLMYFSYKAAGQPHSNQWWFLGGTLYLLIQLIVIYCFRLTRVLIKVQGGWELIDRFRIGVVRRIVLEGDIRVEVRQHQDRYFEVWLYSTTGNSMVDRYPAHAQADQLASYIRQIL
ncbi:MAG TPA: hypothetical protein PLX35_08965 [Cyclobacteriaceae bacterium]|nr:hypothetical protein [Cyclobacteriaceae bacterium]